MKMKALALALAASTVVTGAADAQVITRTYTASASFAHGPFSKLMASATISFDPTVANSASLLSFTSSNADIFKNAQMGAFLNKGNNAFYFGGEPSGPFSLSSSANDFVWSLAVDDAGDITNNGSISYSLVGDQTIYDTGFSDGSIRVSVSEPSSAAPTAVASAVPEPVTWAMMLAGFGMIGGAARYRRRTATVTYA